MDFSLINLHSSFSGIYIYALIVLGIVPIIATLVSFARHVIGFNGFSVFVTIITTIAFLELGFLAGLLIGSLIFASTIFARGILARFRFHYFVRISFVYTAVCFLVFFVIALLSIFLDFKILETTALFPTILLITLIEDYYNTTIREGEKRTTLMYGETLVISSVSYFLITSKFFSEFVLNNVWILLLLFPINLFIATYQGLRLSEFYRFKSVIQNEMKVLEEEDDEDNKKNKKKCAKPDVQNKADVPPKTFIW